MSELDLKIIFDGKKCLIHKNKNNDNLYIKQKGKNINVSHLFCKNKQVLKKQFQLKHRIKKIKGGVLYSYLNNAFVNIYDTYVTELSNGICKYIPVDKDKDNIKIYILKILQGYFNSNFDVVLKNAIYNRNEAQSADWAQSADDPTIGDDISNQIRDNINSIFQNIKPGDETIKNNEYIQNAIYNFYKKEYFIYLNLLIDMLIIQFMYVHSHSSTTTTNELDGKITQKSEQNFTKTSAAAQLISNLLKLDNFREILIAYHDLNCLYNDLHKFKVDLYIGCLGSITSGGNYHTHTSNITDYLEYLKNIPKYNYIHFYADQESTTVENPLENSLETKKILSQEVFSTKNSNTRISEIFKDIERMYDNKGEEAVARYEVHVIKYLFIEKYEKLSFNINYETNEFKELKTNIQNIIEEGNGEVVGEGEVVGVGDSVNSSGP